jgi:sulfur-carrier protein
VTLKIKFIGALRHITGKTQLSLPFQEDKSIKDLINDISQDIPEFEKTLCTQELNNSNSNSLILINGKEISVLRGYETKLNDKDEIVFVPVVHGG